MALVTQAVFARMCETSPKTVTKWKQEKRLVMQGNLVDVDATHEHMKRYRRNGSPIVKSAGAVAHQGNDTTVTSDKGNGQIVTLPVAEVVGRLAELDWIGCFEWSRSAQEQRAREACRCIGWQACTSPAQDDGHWGGYQLRIAGAQLQDWPNSAGIVAGFGYELSPVEVLYAVREELETVLDTDDVMEVDLSRLSLLAHPLYEDEKPRASQWVRQ